MANKDYVRRGQGRKKTPSRSKKITKKPWKASVLALILVVGFGYGLYVLNHTPSPKSPDTVTTTAQKKAGQSKDNATLPPPPKEKWDYVKTLPNKEVEVTAKELKVSNVPYLMQCGAYKTQAQADERKANIAFQGLQSHIVRKEGSSWYRVVLGPYKTKRQAGSDRHKLQRAKIEPCLIMKDNQ